MASTTDAVGFHLRWTARDSNPGRRGEKSVHRNRRPYLNSKFLERYFRIYARQPLINERWVVRIRWVVQIPIGGPSLIARNIISCISRSVVVVGRFLSAAGNGMINHVGTCFQKKDCAEMHSSRTKNQKQWQHLIHRLWNTPHKLIIDDPLSRSPIHFQITNFINPHPPQFATGRTASFWGTR